MSYILNMAYSGTFHNCFPSLYKMSYLRLNIDKLACSPGSAAAASIASMVRCLRCCDRTCESRLYFCAAR